MEGKSQNDVGVELDNAMEAHAQQRLQQAAADMELQDQRRRALVSALKSGKFPQTTGTLRRDATGEVNGGFCCLGVACEVAIRDGLDLSRTRRLSGNYTYGTCQGHISTVSLPEAARIWYRFMGNDPHLHVPRRLVEVNDNLAAQWAPDATFAATTLNDTYKLTLPQIGECFQYTFLRDDWEAEHGAAAS